MLIDRRASYVCNVSLRYMSGKKTQGNASSASNIDIDSDIREEESNNLVKQYQNLTHSKWDQLSMKIKEYLLITVFVRTNYWKNFIQSQISNQQRIKRHIQIKVWST